MHLVYNEKVKSKTNNTFYNANPAKMSSFVKIIHGSFLKDYHFGQEYRSSLF